METFNGLNTFLLSVPVVLIALSVASSIINSIIRHNEKQTKAQQLQAELDELNKSYEQKAKERAEFRARQDLIRSNRSEQSF